MDTLWKIGVGFILGTLIACFTIRVPYWPAHTGENFSMCYMDDRITLAAMAFERLGLLKR